MMPSAPAFTSPSRFDKGMGSNALLAASAPFTVEDKCVLEAEEACYVLSLESAMPIFAVGASMRVQGALSPPPHHRCCGRRHVLRLESAMSIFAVGSGRGWGPFDPSQC